MKKLLGLLLLFSVCISFAQTENIYPHVQKIEHHESLVPIGKLNPILRIGKGIDSLTYKCINDYVMMHQIKSKSYPIVVTLVDDVSFKRFKNRVPEKKEAYFLSIAPDKILIIGSDKRGAYYGVLTLLQLLNTKDVLQSLEIIDYPSIPKRGIVEGFYGRPWSFDARMSMIKFMGEMKMNTYIYGPKDDVYHSSPKWREPYPQDAAEHIINLVKQAKKYGVDFYWAIHPGKDIQWTKGDSTALINKFQKMYELGVRAFAVFFDDISGEGTNAKRQAELLNYLDCNFVHRKGDVLPLIMCPTEYNKSWSNPESKYLTILAENLNKDIAVMWTGDYVISDIKQTTMAWINSKIGRKAFVWWNYPVNDYARDHILLGPVYGNDSNISDDLSGFVANPMEYAELSKIALFSVADYTWNPKQYNSQNSWRAAIKSLIPCAVREFEIVAKHMSDLGENGHRYRRNESEDFSPYLIAWEHKVKKGLPIIGDTCSMVINEYLNVGDAARSLLFKSCNETFINEAKPWLLMMSMVSDFGKYVYRMSKYIATDSISFIKNYRSARTLLMLMHDYSDTHNQNPYQPGVKVGEKYYFSTAQRVYTTLVKEFNHIHGVQLNAKAIYVPHKLLTNIDQMQFQDLSLSKNRISIKLPMEYITIQPDQYIGVVLDLIHGIQNVNIELDANDIDGLSLLSGMNKNDLSSVGKWEQKEKGANSLKVNTKLNAKYLLLRNDSNHPLNIKIKRFTFKII